MIAIANKRDFLAGMVFATIGSVALTISIGYKIGTLTRIGSGFFPMILGGMLVLLGLAISVRALRCNKTSMPLIAWRSLIIICLSVALFAFLIDSTGFALSAWALVMLSCLARTGRSWGETILFPIVLMVLCVCVFGYGLRLQIPIWPKFSILGI